MPTFIPGRELNESFYFDVIEPLMKEHFPDLKYSAGFVGHGSDVLGFDSPKLIDHNWGPHGHLFFREEDYIEYKDKVDQMLRKHLPYSYKEFSTNFEEGDIYLKDKPKLIKSGEVNHLFRFWTIQSYFTHYLGFDIRKAPSFRDWLLFPQQSLLEATSGKVFHDDLDFEKVRSLFAYYPDDIWKYMMRVQWGKINHELQMQARSGEEGDELGSMIVTARTIFKIIFMCFLMERTYVPYSKWFGTAFHSWLKSSKTMEPLLLSILHEKDWMKRQKLLVTAYQELGTMHNALGITEEISTEVTDYFGRGYPVIDILPFINALIDSISVEELKNSKYNLGSIDQFIDHARINHTEYVYTEFKDVIK